MWFVLSKCFKVGLFLFFFFCAISLCYSYISGVHHFLWDFLRMWPFFNPTIEVVTFCLRGWCMLGVFLLLAFTRLGHECQDLLSLCNRIHVCTNVPLIYTLIWKSFGGMESEPMLLTPKENPFYRKNSPQRRIKPRALHQVGQWAQHTTSELFQPLDLVQTWHDYSQWQILIPFLITLKII